MKIAIIGDPHLGCSTYTDKRASDFSHQFNEAIRISLESKVQAVFLLGDIFDSSAYRRNIDNFASSLTEIAGSLVRLKDKKIPIFAIAGNHEYGRGRGGGEIRILSDLGFLHFLDDSKEQFDGYEIAGISWKSSVEAFRESVRKLGAPEEHSILLIHQFCYGSAFLPQFLAEVKKDDLKGWQIVFTGHHHHYEDFGYALTPGSLEVHEAKETGEKGFIIYDTDAHSHEFIRLPPSRPVRYVKIVGESKTASEVEDEIRRWVDKNSSWGALLVVNLSGRLASGRSVDVNWNLLRSRAIQSGSLKLHFDGGLEDQVRSAPEIRATINMQEFLKKRFGPKGKTAVDYVQSFKEEGDEFGSEILNQIIEDIKGSKK
jgi:DNA repair exonuclease SbcCD nuclease subunit